MTQQLVRSARPSRRTVGSLGVMLGIAAMGPIIDGPSLGAQTVHGLGAALAGATTAMVEASGDACEATSRPADATAWWHVWGALDSPQFTIDPEIVAEMSLEFGGGSSVPEFPGLTGDPCADTNAALAALPSSSLAMQLGVDAHSLILIDLDAPPPGVRTSFLTPPKSLGSPSPHLCASYATLTLQGPSGSAYALSLIFDGTDWNGVPYSAAMPIDDLQTLRAADPALLPDLDLGLSPDMQEWWAVYSMQGEIATGGICLSECWECETVCERPAYGMACISYCDGGAKDPFGAAAVAAKDTLDAKIAEAEAEFAEKALSAAWNALFCVSAMIGLAAVATKIKALGNTAKRAIEKGGKFLKGQDLSDLGLIIATLLIKSSSGVLVALEILAVVATCLVYLAQSLNAARRTADMKIQSAWAEYREKLANLQLAACGCEATVPPTLEVPCIAATF